MGREAMTRRIQFLTRRAQAADNASHADDSIRLGCKGTLLRDAAALALLSEDYDLAADLLQAAGHIWASIGLFAGYKLLWMSGLTDWPHMYEPDLQQIATLLDWQLGNSSEPPPKPHNRPLLAAATSAPRQLIDLYLALQQHGDPWGNQLRDQVRSTLQRNDTATVGNTRLSDLLFVIDGIERGWLETPELDALRTLFRHREEWLIAAQADAYHWQRGLDPSGIVDFDLIAIATRAIESNAAEVLDDFIGSLPPLLTLPWTTARGLSLRPATGFLQR